MDKIALGLIALRASALAAALSGQHVLANQLYQLADFIAAGLVSDAMMKEVADKLATRNAVDSDFADVLTRIEQHRGELHSPV